MIAIEVLPEKSMVSPKKVWNFNNLYNNKIN